MKYFIIAILTWLFVKHTSAQNTGSIQLKLKSESASENYYNILLKKVADSSILKIENAKPGEIIEYQQIPYGHYFLQVMYLNLLVLSSKPFEVQKNLTLLEDLEVKPVAAELKELKISAKKNMIERKTDKLIYNVDATLTSAGEDALDILQKSPGISVDPNGNISMRGKSGVLVMINGKTSFVQGEQLNNLLKSTMGNQISKIEIISNPSSKYDANGNAGIVNIILKKEMKQGSNGTVNLSYGKGYYRKSNNSISLNHRRDRLNFFASYQFVNNIGFNDLRLYRQFYAQGKYEGAYHQNNYIVFPFYNHISKIGMDFNPTSKTILGVVVNGILNKFNPFGDNKTFIEDSNYTRQSYYTTANRSKDLWYNFGANINFKHDFDSSGTELSADADYVQFGNFTTQNFTTRYFDLQDHENKAAYLLLGKIKGQLGIKTLKADYIHPMKNNVKLECGFKTSFVKADNNLEFYNESSGAAIYDSTQSNHFIYKENINALYASLSGERKKNSIQIGLRAEQTIAHGNQINNQISFSRNYWQLFPTFFLTHKFNANHDVGFSFSRRIQRPTYDQLNPFKFFLDPSTYKEGNPYLVPQNAYIFEISHTFLQQFTTTLSSNITNKSITEVLIPAEGQNNITIQTNKNVNKQYVYSLGISAPYKIKKWWNSMLDASVYYSEYDGELASQPIHSSTISFNAKSMHTFTLPKQFTLQVDAFVQYAERYSFSTLSPFGSVNLSLQKSAWSKRATFKFSANDLFYTSRFRGSSHFNNYHEDFYVQRDSRNFMLALSYRFGNNALPASRRRTGGAEDEKQRAGKNV